MAAKDMTTRGKLIIKKAFDSMKGDYIYICDLMEASGLPEAFFKRAFSELVAKSNVELEPGFGEWANKKKPFKYGDEEFYGVKWVEDLPMSKIERLWFHRSEIMKAWEIPGNEKNAAVARGVELSGVGDSTVSPYIAHFPFLCAEFDWMEREREEQKKRIESLEKAHKGLLAEIDTRDREIETLKAELAREPAPLETEPEQTKLFDKGDDDMTELQTLKAQMMTMQEQIDSLKSLFSKPEPATIQEQPKPEKFKIGRWAIVFTKRGHFMATRRLKDLGPVSIHCGKDREAVESILREKLKGKGLEIDF